MNCDCGNILTLGENCCSLPGNVGCVGQRVQEPTGHDSSRVEVQEEAKRKTTSCACEKQENKLVKARQWSVVVKFEAEAPTDRDSPGFITKQ